LVAIYRQRATVADDFLLRVVFPWLTSLHVTPMVPFARFWSEPVDWGEIAMPQPSGSQTFWGKIVSWNFEISTNGTFPQLKRRQSSVN
jgi:hypothetical protein